MTPEGRVKAKIKRALDALGADAWYYMPVSTGYGKHGVPDFLLCIKGRFMSIEAKANGGQCTALQERQMSLMRGAGAVTFVIDEHSVDAFCNNLKVYAECARTIP